MPTLVEQITQDSKLVIDFDEIIKSQEKTNILMKTLGVDVFQIQPSVYQCELEPNKKIILLVKQITYLGNPHPIYKKRIQIPRSWIDLSSQYRDFDVRFIGIYKYASSIVFVDFEKSGYLSRNVHNSSAHVYTNDLYQASTQGVFSRKDSRNNLITSIRDSEFKKYLTNAVSFAPQNRYLEKLIEFNQRFPFGQWVSSEEAYAEMLTTGSPDWAQGEWPGFWLENKARLFYNSRDEFHLVNFIKHKGQEDLDFDLKFSSGSELFFGDLKASDVCKNESPGNDKTNLLEALKSGGKFWYVIFEHETEKDSEPYVATRNYNSLKLEHGKWPAGKEYSPLSYSSRMKKRVRFIKMQVLELNEANYAHALTDFSQGRQPDGKPRKTKFMIKKKDIENFVIFSYEVSQ